MSREKLLASATTTDGTLVSGTRDALLVGDHRIPWEHVQHADWDADTSSLVVAEVGTWGEQRPVHTLAMEAHPDRLLQLVRERVTASIVLQRHVPVRGRTGVVVVARRAPRGDRPIEWFYEYQDGIDPTDAEVRRLAAAALSRARDEVGLE